MAHSGPKVLPRSEAAKLLASETGISDREAERILYGISRVIERTVIAGHGISLSQSLRISPKPITPRKRYNLIRETVDDESGYWSVTLDVSRSLRKRLREELGEPSPLDFKNFNEAKKKDWKFHGPQSKHWKRKRNP